MLMISELSLLLLLCYHTYKGGINMQNRGIFGAILMVGSLITIMIGTLNNTGAGLIGIAMYISIVLFIVGIIDVVLYAVSFRKSKYPNLM